MRRAVKRLAGAYAIAVVSSREPHTVVGARAGSPLVIGAGEGVDPREWAAASAEDRLRIAEHPERAAAEGEQEGDGGGGEETSRSHTSHTPDIPP